MKMDKCKFKNPVIPGDILICKLELISPIRRGIIHMHGQSFVGNEDFLVTAGDTLLPTGDRIIKKLLKPNDLEIEIKFIVSFKKFFR